MNKKMNFLIFLLSILGVYILPTEKQPRCLLDIIHSIDFLKRNQNLLVIWLKEIQNFQWLKLQECAKTYQHWYTEIKNLFEVPYSNGATECCNNKIKVLKRISFAMRSSNNFIIKQITLSFIKYTYFFNYVNWFINHT